MQHKPLLLTLLTVFILACGSAQQAVQTADDPERTPTTEFTQTPSSTPTPAATPTRQPTKTKTPDFSATVEAKRFEELVLTHFDDELLQQVDGDYYPLDDYSDHLAQKGYFSWSVYDLNIRNFILRTKVQMATANVMSNTTGCGVVFRTVGEYAESIFIQQNGEVFYGAGDTSINSGYYKRLGNPAEFELVLMVNEKSYRVFIDGDLSLMGDTILDPSLGGVGFAVQSGSNDDFGSQCDFTDNDLWALKKK